ncbi:basic proline-rich protein-like [Cervus elaphus]|uniref:basic proline-rich protein-like n=1 Tax=Cervus elaphus TaxID=9860 RepID=UPI001CC2BE41|nr:basic proline-rich protein-like [Cervus elaphus]
MTSLNNTLRVGKAGEQKLKLKVLSRERRLSGGEKQVVREPGAAGLEDPRGPRSTRTRLGEDVERPPPAFLCPHPVPGKRGPPTCHLGGSRSQTQRGPRGALRTGGRGPRAAAATALPRLGQLVGEAGSASLLQAGPRAWTPTHTRNRRASIHTHKHTHPQPQSASAAGQRDPGAPFGRRRDPAAAGSAFRGYRLPAPRPRLYLRPPPPRVRLPPPPGWPQAARSIPAAPAPRPAEPGPPPAPRPSPGAGPPPAPTPPGSRARPGGREGLGSAGTLAARDPGGLRWGTGASRLGERLPPLGRECSGFGALAGAAGEGAPREGHGSRADAGRLLPPPPFLLAPRSTSQQVLHLLTPSPWLIPLPGATPPEPRPSALLLPHSVAGPPAPSAGRGRRAARASHSLSSQRPPPGEDPPAARDPRASSSSSPPPTRSRAHLCDRQLAELG